jgi:hypothetical protein
VRPIVDSIRFATEISVLAALAIAGASLAWPLALVLPASFALAWGRWVAPRSTTRLADPARLATEVALFVSAGAALAATTSLVLGLVLALVGVATSVLTRG